MRETFNNNPQQILNKKPSSKQQIAQLSQRSTQVANSHQIVPSHQKTQSFTSGKVNHQVPNQYQALTAYEEQTLSQNKNLAQYQMNNQQMLMQSSTSQIAQMNALQNNNYKNIQMIQPQHQQQQIMGKQTHQINSGIGGAIHHKKANSLMNSKMAQLLLKGVNNGGILQNNQGPNNNSINTGNTGKGIIEESLVSQQLEQKNIHHPNISNLTSSLGSNVPVSNSTSFANNEIISYSQDYQKPYQQVDEVDNNNMEFIYQQVDQPFYQVPSNKVFLPNQQQFQLDQFLHQQQQQEATIKKQSQQQLSNNKQNHLKLSSSKGSNKKTSSAGGSSHHQRTKSDNIYNRGSIMASGGPSAGVQNNTNKNLGSSQQQKRNNNNAGVSLQNNYVEFQQIEQPLVKPTHMKHSSMGSGFVLQTHDNHNVATNPRKAPTSAHGPKKTQQQTIQQQQKEQSKKSTREKYIELKVLYNDLLERHYALATTQQQQQQQQQQQPPLNPHQQQVRPSQQQSNQNLFNFYPLPQQQMQYMGEISGQSSNNNSNTPRILINSQISAQNLNNNMFSKDQLESELINGIIQPISKTIKHSTNKLDTNILDQNQKNQQKASLKMQLQSAQGVSRKAGGNHKRSVSDGNEQFFKFKQAAMQRYLYPQPSNQTINGPQIFQQQVFVEDQKNLLSLQQQYQVANHQRRVSDDYQQKIKKQQIHLQQQIIGQNNKNISKGNNPSQNNLLENVPQEPPDNQKLPPNVDFNIKGFLIEMRNKQGNIQVVDQQLNEQNKVKSNKQIAMIIEENSPQGINQTNYFNEQILLGQQPSTMTLESSRRLLGVDSSGGISLPGVKLLNNNLVQASKPVIEFNKVHQKYRHLQLENQGVEIDLQQLMKRTSSPSLERSIEDNKIIKQSVNHKRVKSDVPDVGSMYQKKSGPSVLMSVPTSVNRMNKKTSQQTSNSNLLYSDKTTPRKIKQTIQNTNKQIPKNQHAIISATGIQYLPQQQQFMGGVGGSSSKKIINVSIDLIKDGELDQSAIDDTQHPIDGGQWIVVDNSQSNLNDIQFHTKSKQKMQTLLKSGEINKLNAMSGGSNEALRQDKYKKMKSKYQNNNLFNEQSESTLDQYQDNKQILATTEDKVQNIYNQTSPVTQQKKKDIFKFNEQKKQNGQISANVLSKQNMMNVGSPKQNEKVFKKKDIKPSNKINSTPVQQSKKRDSNNSQKLKSQQEQQQQQKKQTVAPTNSVVQTQESARNSQIQQNQQQLVIQSDMRLDTLDSTVSDPNQSPRQKMTTKLIKHIKLSFRQNQAPPNTTVDFYRIGKVLGKGAFGKVNLALHKLTHKFAAVKSINKQYLSEEAQTKKVMQEVVILKRTRHRNIVRLYEFFETQKHILFVIELCAGGDLLNYVRKRRRLKEDVAKFIFKQIVEGLGYCHTKQILHRDIKLDNILLNSEGEVKICDFGVSKIVKKGEKMTEQCGTPAYIAPEILRDRGYEGFAVDIWSAGVVLYAMLYGTVPFKANNMSELQKLIIKAKYTLKEDGVSEEARDLIRLCLEKDPVKRITIQSILNHEWLSDAQETMQLFTDQEKDYIKNEFTYNDAERYNRNEGGDPFTDHQLDSTQNSLFKNCTSKSVILAPFNSTKSNLDDQEGGLSDSVKELMQSKGCIKFAARIRDIDKQYEVNNNAELDNGVYHKFAEEEEEKNNKKDEINESDDSLQSSFNKESSLKSDDDEEARRIKEQEKKRREEKAKSKKKKKQTELEKLESLIQQEEDEQEVLNTEQNEEESKLDDKNPYGEGFHIQNDKNKSHKHNTNDIPDNVLQSAQTLIIDEKIASQVESYGFPKEYIIKCLNNNELNYASTSYFLLLNQHTLSLSDKNDINNKAGLQSTRELNQNASKLTLL